MEGFVLNRKTEPATSHQKALNFNDLAEGIPFMAVAKVVPLFDRNGQQKGFKIISIIKIDHKKKEQKQEVKQETLESVTEEDERI